MSERQPKRLSIVGRVRRAAGKVVRRVRRFADVKMHPGRLEAASRRLRDVQRPQSILVICYGNICRSPYLEAVLREALPDMTVSSAGFVGAGRGVPPHSATLSQQRGLDLSEHKSRLVSHDILSNSDVIIVMDTTQANALQGAFRVPREQIFIAGDLDPQQGDARTIHDPWNQSIDVFEAAFNRLDRIGKHVASLIKRPS